MTDFCLRNNKSHLKGFQTNLKHFLRFRPPRAGRMGKFRPLPEPIRLQDLYNFRSRTEKKISEEYCILLKKL